MGHELDPTSGFAPYVHIDDGDRDHDHDARPSAFDRSIAEWQRLRPDLFQTYADDKVGPNSAFHVRGRRA